jgi:SAM-dependent methyltransferase
MKYAESAQADYYQRLHDVNAAFQGNNWLLDEISVLRALGGRSILELGCGNGLFLRAAAPHWEEVVGVDWAKSPVIESVLKEHGNVRFEQADVRTWRPGRQFHIVASADFLEHIPPPDLPALIAAAATCGPRQFHKIACYDDGHSHLSIFPPEQWIELFERAAPGVAWRIHSRLSRKGDPNKTVVMVLGAAGQD